MKLTGIHALLTYRCTFACDHCFVFGSPWQDGTMTLKDIRNTLQQAKDLGTVEWIFFEGGEPFLYYATLLKGVQEAVEMGFKVGIVSNAYWAISPADAVEWLAPFAGLLENLSVSSDLFHFNEELSQMAKNACAAATIIGIPVGTMSVAQPETTDAAKVTGQLPMGESGVMYRGRAAINLIDRTTHQPWEQFSECPHEDLVDPGRVHLDPLGNLHLCQGISIGNMFNTPLSDICASYDPQADPVIGALLDDGPAELVRRFDLPHKDVYADACHLCFEARLQLRDRFPDTLTPDQVYIDPA